jgi:phosphoribosylformylglycinamidine synthase subunit PurL
VVLDKIWGLPPALDMDYEKRVHTAIREVVNAGLAESAHDLSDGGLTVALAECSKDGVGAAIELTTDLAPELALFHEGPSRVLVSTAVPEQVERIARDQGVEILRLGVTMKAGLRIDVNTVTLIDLRVDQLRQVSENALEGHLAAQHV